MNHSIENLYARENELIHAVTSGQPHHAKTHMNQILLHHFPEHMSDPLRNTKNYALSLNTLLRKAAETSSVPTAYISKLSKHFILSIEEAKSKQAITFLLKTMARKYALLVKNHSLKGYSPLIRKVLVHINTDLSCDLSLKAQAKQLHLNSSYLSALFKSEVGCTLTEYVTRKRMEHAVHLLNSTNLQVQTIAQECGIADVGYFSKIFKKYIGRTPSDYRESIK